MANNTINAASKKRGDEGAPLFTARYDEVKLGDPDIYFD